MKRQVTKILCICILVITSWIKYYFTEANPRAIFILLPEKIYFGIEYKF